MVVTHILTLFQSSTWHAENAVYVGLAGSEGLTGHECHPGHASHAGHASHSGHECTAPSQHTLDFPRAPKLCKCHLCGWEESLRVTLQTFAMCHW